MRLISRAMLATALAAGALPLAAQAQPRPAAVSRSAEAVSIIEAVSQSERSVILRNEAGELKTLFLGKGVRNLPQVKAGDRVVTRVTQAVAVELDEPGATPAAGEAIGVAPPGSLPGATLVRGARGVVTVESFDRRSNTIVVADDKGVQQSFVLKTQKMRDFARRLRRGDKVDVAIMEAVSIDVVR
jgi:protein-disulfide isomerase